MEQYQVSFNSNRLDLVDGVDLYNYDFTTLPNRDIKIHKLARRSLSIVTSSEYTDKNIPIWLDICSGDRQDTEITVKQIKGLLTGQNGELKVLQAGLEVIYTATMNEFNIEWQGAHAYVTIIFIASTPIGIATSSDILVSVTGHTTSSLNTSFTVEGSFNAEPIITINLSAVTGGTGDLSVLNGRTQQGITISRTFVSGDIIIINSATLEATVNGINVDFTGLFPTFPPGSQEVAYTDTFTTRTMDFDMRAPQRLI